MVGKHNVTVLVPKCTLDRLDLKYHNDILVLFLLTFNILNSMIYDLWCLTPLSTIY